MKVVLISAGNDTVKCLTPWKKHVYEKFQSFKQYIEVKKKNYPFAKNLKRTLNDGCMF